MGLEDFLKSGVGDFHDSRADCIIKPENGAMWLVEEKIFDGVCLHHSGTFKADTPKYIADYHVNTRGWAAIAYHVLVTKVGLVHLCKDPKYRGAHCGDTYGNKMYLAVCCEGNFTVEQPTAVQVRRLSEVLTAIEVWKGAGFKVMGHKSFVATACPGNLLGVWQEYERKEWERIQEEQRQQEAERKEQRRKARWFARLMAKLRRLE